VVRVRVLLTTNNFSRQVPGAFEEVFFLDFGAAVQTFGLPADDRPTAFAALSGLPGRTVRTLLELFDLLFDILIRQGRAVPDQFPHGPAGHRQRVHSLAKMLEFIFELVALPAVRAASDWVTSICDWWCSGMTCMTPEDVRGACNDDGIPTEIREAGHPLESTQTLPD